MENENELLNKIFEAKPSDFEYMGNNAFKYNELFIELRPDTFYIENEIAEMDFAIFKTEEDMNTDYEKNIVTDYWAMTPVNEYWNYVRKICNIKQMFELQKSHQITLI